MHVYKKKHCLSSTGLQHTAGALSLQDSTAAEQIPSTCSLQAYLHNLNSLVKSGAPAESCMVPAVSQSSNQVLQAQGHAAFCKISA
jgi:hypothetical protein